MGKASYIQKCVDTFTFIKSKSYITRRFYDKEIIEFIDKALSNDIIKINERVNQSLINLKNAFSNDNDYNNNYENYINDFHSLSDNLNIIAVKEFINEFITINELDNINDDNISINTLSTDNLC
uniref:Uncharacterized protein n=1 Tax=viral metagenome TaxID=1070528 RepID=A0A6C0KV33_9ZZZZ